MSQASKSLKKIAASEEYKALVSAIEAKDYVTIARSYTQLGQLIEEEKKQVLEKIRALPRQNKDEDCEQFQTAFALRASTTLPMWHWLNLQLKEQGVSEGEVFGVGSKGDPLVRTAEGRIVVINGSALEKGTRVRFRVVTPGQKLDFGRVIEFSPEYFSSLLNREARDGIKKAFNAAEEYLKSGPVDVSEAGLARLSERLKELESIRELAGKLEAAEKEETIARILMYRQRLLNGCGVKLAFDFMSREEEREIAETCQGNEQALSAPGLFRYQPHQKLKAKLLDGEEPRGYSGLLKSLESQLESMNAALELMEFKSKVEKVYPLARTYLDRMDRLFDRLNRKARQTASAMAEARLSSQEEITAAIKNAFSGAALDSELRRTFRNAEEFYALRSALAELRALLDHRESLTAESALRPYLARRITALSANRSIA